MWAHKGWSGTYLPEKLGRSEQIAAYASWCTSVEGNTTHTACYTSILNSSRYAEFARWSSDVRRYR